MLKKIPYLLLAAGAATALGEAVFFTSGAHRVAMFAAIVAAGVGYFWDKFAK